MAKLIYAVTAAALAALVAGFFVDTSNLPLFLSIGLSAVVMLLILFGWSRKVRSNIDELLGDTKKPQEVTDISVIEDEPDEEKPKAKPRKQRPVITGARKPADVTAVIQRPKAAARKPVPSKPAARRTSPPKPPPRKPVPPPIAPVVRAPPKMKAKPKPQPKAKPKPKPKATAKKAKASTKRVVVIPGRERFHRRGCRFAQSDEAREVRETTARDRGYEPCTVCKP